MLKEAVLNEEFVLEQISEVIDKIYVYDKEAVEMVWKFYADSKVRYLLYVD